MKLFRNIKTIDFLPGFSAVIKSNLYFHESQHYNNVLLKHSSLGGPPRAPLPIKTVSIVSC